MATIENRFHPSGYIKRGSDNLEDYLLGKGLGTGSGSGSLTDLALMAQRGTAAKHNLAQTAYTEAQTTGQLSENEKLAAQALAIKNATNNETFSSMFGSNAPLANIAAANAPQIKQILEELNMEKVVNLLKGLTLLIK